MNEELIRHYQKYSKLDRCLDIAHSDIIDINCNKDEATPTSSNP